MKPEEIFEKVTPGDLLYRVNGDEVVIVTYKETEIVLADCQLNYYPVVDYEGKRVVDKSGWEWYRGYSIAVSWAVLAIEQEIHKHEQEIKKHQRCIERFKKELYKRGFDVMTYNELRDSE